MLCPQESAWLYSAADPDGSFDQTKLLHLYWGLCSQREKSEIPLQKNLLKLYCIGIILRIPTKKTSL